jgi:hypothetical protein
MRNSDSNSYDYEWHANATDMVQQPDSVRSPVLFTMSDVTLFQKYGITR